MGDNQFWNNPLHQSHTNGHKYINSPDELANEYEALMRKSAPTFTTPKPNPPQIQEQDQLHAQIQSLQEQVRAQQNKQEQLHKQLEQHRQQLQTLTTPTSSPSQPSRKKMQQNPPQPTPPAMNNSFAANAYPSDTSISHDVSTDYPQSDATLTRLQHKLENYLPSANPEQRKLKNNEQFSDDSSDYSSDNDADLSTPITAPHPPVNNAKSPDSNTFTSPNANHSNIPTSNNPNAKTNNVPAISTADLHPANSTNSRKANNTESVPANYQNYFTASNKFLHVPLYLAVTFILYLFDLVVIHWGWPRNPAPTTTSPHFPPASSTHPP